MARTKSKTVWLSKDLGVLGGFPDRVYAWPQKPTLRDTGNYEGPNILWHCPNSEVGRGLPWLKKGDCIKVQIKTTVIHHIETKAEFLARLSSSKKTPANQIKDCVEWIEANG